MQSFRELKTEIRQYLTSRDAFNVEDSIIEEYKLTEDQSDSLQGIIKKVSLKQLAVKDVVVALVSIGVSPNDAKSITAKIIESHFAPFKDFYEIPEGFIQKGENKEGGSGINPDTAIEGADVKTNQNKDAVAELVEGFGLKITDELLNKRLYNVIDSRLREVRTPQQFKEILGRPQKVGGMGFQADRVDMICKEVEKAFASMQKKVKIERPAMGVAISDERLPSTTKAAEPNLSLKSRYDSVSVSEVAKTKVPKSVMEKARAGSSSLSPTFVKPVQEPIPRPQVSEPPAKQIPIIVTRPAPPPESGAKEVIHDVKREGVPLNLVDELSLIDINEFRKMGLENLKANIDSLAKESYAKKIAGIGAWRKSPVYKMYTELGNLSLETGSVEESVKSLQSKGAQTLTREEFDAISEFNTLLSS